MNSKLSELKLPKIRCVLEYEVDGEQKQIIVYNALGKKRENLISIISTGNKITDKAQASEMLYKSILKELVEVDIDVKKTAGLLKAPSLTLLQLNHELDEIMCELQCEYIYAQMRMLNQAKISTLTALSLKKMDDMTKEVERLNADI